MSHLGHKHTPETLARMRDSQRRARDTCVHCSRATTFTFTRQRLCAPCFNAGMKAMVARLAAERKLS